MNLSYPKISVITPSLNQAGFIEQTIKSVVSQGYQNLEYIIQDGGSSDGSLKIIEKYSKRFPNLIKWESKKDGGQIDAINKGFKKATGDILAYINSDDYYLPGSFAKVAEYFRSNPHKLWLVGNCRVSQPNLNWTFKIKHVWPIQQFPFTLKIFNWINQPSVFLTKNLVKRVGEFDKSYKYAFDYDYWLRCIQISTPGRISTTLSVFRIHDSSLTKLFFTKQFSEDLSIISKYTNNQTVIFLHKLIGHITVNSYRLLKT